MVQIDFLELFPLLFLTIWEEIQFMGFMSRSILITIVDYAARVRMKPKLIISIAIWY